MRYGRGVNDFEPLTSTGSVDAALCKALQARGEWGLELIMNIEAAKKPTNEYLKLISN